MEQNKNLMDQVFPLNNYADNLMEAIPQIAAVSDTDDHGNNIFPSKKRVIEIMADALLKMREVATQIEESSPICHEPSSIAESDGQLITKNDAAILYELKSCSQKFSKRIQELSEVNTEFIHRLDKDTLEDDVNILQFITRAIDDFRFLIDLINDIKYESDE